jgi:DNA-binding transcriptional LysR family regulator
MMAGISWNGTIALMPDRRLQAFHAVAKHRSFTKAADALCMTQPAVTFQIRQLEEHFDTRLFDRANGRIALTPAGMVALGYAERILGLYGELDAKVKELTGQEVGPLTIGASTTIAEFLLPRIVGEFKSKHPGIVPQLVVANSETVQARVAERSLDLGFIEGDSHLRTLVTDVCCEDELQVVCAPSHPLARQKTVAVEALTEHPYVIRELGSGTREVIDHYLQKAGLSLDSLHIVMEATSPEALKGLVTTGLGFTIMSRAAVEKEVRLGDLVRIPLAPPLIRHLAVVYPKERIHAKVVNDFVRFAKDRLASSRDVRSDPLHERAERRARPSPPRA